MGSNISDVLTPRIMDAVRVIVQALRESGRAAERDAGISGAQLFVLHTLAGEPAMTMNTLAARTHTHQSSVSTVVSRLVDRGLVTRTTPAADGRQRQLTLSPQGARLAARAPDAAQIRLIAAIKRLPAERRRLLASTLTELGQALAGVERVPPMFFEKTVRRGVSARRGRTTGVRRG
jgi:DNA-binding MarR family transcriptional regulator